MPGFKEAPEGSLEARAIAAHRAYLAALLAWERAVHEANCPICRSQNHTSEDYERSCEVAEAEKERCRITFRDLCNELGFVPTGHGLELPIEVPPCCGGSQSN